MKIISIKNLFHTKFLNLVETEYINTAGNVSQWVSAERTGNRKAVMIVAEYGDKLVLIKEFRIPVQDFEWSFPAGLIDENEDIETAARREFFEETGLRVSEILKISPFVINSAGLSNEAISIVFAKAEGEISYSKLEESEELTVHILNKSEVKEILEDKINIISAKAWIIMDFFVNK
jgi:ADP-ribose pyrophosphatase